ncbi:hypothetical protein ACWD4L_27135 [Streptomyces sp. NPDC002596]
MPTDVRVLIQGCAPGAEYSVESFTQDGSTAHLCATAKAVTQGTHRVEIGHSLPAVLPPAVERAVFAEVD